MELVIITTVAIGLIMAAMAVGVYLSGRPLRGSCGGPAILGPDGAPMTCPDCDCQVDGGIDGAIDRGRPDPTG